MSAVPVREAIRRLEAEGLVIYRANVGAQVAPSDPALYEQELTVLGVLEGYATALTAAVITESEVALLEAKTDDMEACMQRLDVLGFGRANYEFHLVIYERCPNPYLVGVLFDTARRLDAIRRTVFTHIQYRGVESIREHRHLIELIRSKAAFPKIELAAREHKLRTARAFREWREQHDAADAADAASAAGASSSGPPPRRAAAGNGRRRKRAGAA